MNTLAICREGIGVEGDVNMPKGIRVGVTYSNSLRSLKL